MAFYGCEFTFDGKSSLAYGLMIFDIESYSQGDVDIPTGTIVEERISGRYDALAYGIKQNNPLEFTLVFGANTETTDRGTPLDRYDVDAISAWLVGHGDYRYFAISQPDMRDFRYKVIISGLKLITYGGHPWAFQCKVTCDAPYAYTYPFETVIECSGTTNVTFYNRASYHGFYKPKLVISTSGGGSVSITNVSDGNRVCSFTNLPTSVHEVTVDNLNQIITTDSAVNPYSYFNMKFFRLVRGDNSLTIAGNAEVKIICEFPVNIGG